MASRNRRLLFSDSFVLLSLLAGCIQKLSVDADTWKSRCPVFPRSLPQWEAKQWQRRLPSPGIWCQRTNVKDSRKKLRAGVWWSHSWLRHVVQHPTQLFRFYRILQVPTKEEIFFPGDIVWSFFLYFKKIYETRFFLFPESSKFIFMAYIVFKFICCSLNCWDEMMPLLFPLLSTQGSLQIGEDWLLEISFG